MPARIVLLAAGAGMGAASASAQLSFSEQAATAGITHSHATVLNGSDMEFYSAGGAVGDFNRDSSFNFFDVSSFLASYNPGCP